MGILYLAFQTLGVVYGDVATSPLYVFAHIFEAPPSEADVIGALSLILWSLSTIVSFKYALIVLRASDSGQGTQHCACCSLDSESLSFTVCMTTVHKACMAVAVVSKYRSLQVVHLLYILCSREQGTSALLDKHIQQTQPLSATASLKAVSAQPL